MSNDTFPIVPDDEAGDLRNAVRQEFAALKAGWYGSEGPNREWAAQGIVQNLRCLEAVLEREVQA